VSTLDFYFRDDHRIYGDYIPWTPLQYACDLGLDVTARFLLKNGADYSIQDKTGRNALEITRYLNHPTIILILEKWIYSYGFTYKISSMKCYDVCFFSTTM
jgi:hypothetical protein